MQPRQKSAGTGHARGQGGELKPASDSLLREATPVGVGGSKGAGRPHVPIEIDTTRLVSCGLHIAARHATLALLDLRGRILARERVPHQGSDPQHVLAPLARRVPGSSPSTLAAGCRPLEAAGLPVRVGNHARSLARAEQLFGDPRARGSVLHLFVGNVVDAAFATGGRVHRGPQSAAGAVAHLPLEGRTEQCSCGRRGCLQAAVSSRALALRAARERVTREPSFDALLAAAKAGAPGLSACSVSAPG